MVFMSSCVDGWMDKALRLFQPEILYQDVSSVTGLVLSHGIKFTDKGSFLLGYSLLT